MFLRPPGAFASSCCFISASHCAPTCALRVSSATCRFKPGGPVPARSFSGNSPVQPDKMLCSIPARGSNPRSRSFASSHSAARLAHARSLKAPLGALRELTEVEDEDVDEEEGVGFCLKLWLAFA